VKIYKSSDKDYDDYDLTQADVVLTTYHELSISCPFPSKKQIAELKQHHKDVDVGIENWVSNSMDDAGLLHQLTWYRVRDFLPTFLKNVLMRYSAGGN
jgi:hypothetical protein